VTLILPLTFREFRDDDDLRQCILRAQRYHLRIHSLSCGATMNASTQAETLALAKGDQKRLERLAGLAGRSPKAMLKFVLRDGFDAVEDEICESLAAERDMALHGAVPHAEVMRSAKILIEAVRVGNRKKTA
jgi:hypothetical protein